MMSMDQILTLIVKAIKAAARGRNIKISNKNYGYVYISIENYLYVTLSCTSVKIRKNEQTAYFPISDFESLGLAELATNFFMLITGVTKPKEFFS